MENITQPISTGFKDLDLSIDGGFYPCTLICLGSRPAMGKTAFLLSVCRKYESADIQYRFIATQESAEHIIKRSENRIPKNRITDSITCIEELEEYISSKYESCKVFFLDGFHSLRKCSGLNSYEEVSQVILALKKICMKFRICIVITSQLSRKCEERQGHRPKLTDLRDSGEIEDICDIVLLLLRREYYDIQDKPGLAEIIIAKNRQGKWDAINLIYDKEKTLFWDHNPLIYKPLEESGEAEETLSKFGVFMPK